MSWRVFFIITALSILGACTDGTSLIDNSYDNWQDWAGSTDAADLDQDGDIDERDFELSEADSGCHRLENGEGYDKLQDAIDLSDSGATIMLCESSFKEKVVVTKDLNLVGAGFEWSAPANEANLTIEGAAVTMNNIFMTSTRSAIQGTGTTLNLSQVTLSEMGNYGITVTDSSVVASNIAIDNAHWGGIKLSGGSLDLSNSSILNSTGFGVLIESEGEGVFKENEIGYTGYSQNPDGGIWDGWGVWLTGDSVGTFTDNQFINNVSAVTGEQATVTMTGDSVQGGSLGISLNIGSGTLTDVNVLDVYQFGIFATALDSLVLTDVNVMTDSDTARVPENHFSEDTVDGSIGILSVDTDLNMTGGIVSGHNGAGIMTFPQYQTRVALFMQDVYVDDNARLGIYANRTDAELEDIDIVNTRDDDETCKIDTTYYCNFAFQTFDGDVHWDTGVVKNNGTAGVVSFEAVFDGTNLLFENNDQFGVYGDDTAVLLTNSSFINGGEMGLNLQEANAVLDNLVFQDAQYIDVYTYETDEGDIEETHYYYDAQDIYAKESTLDVSNSSFSGGEQAIWAYDSSVDILDCTFEDYNEYGLYLYGSSSGNGTVKRTTFDNMGGYIIYCGGDSMEVEDVTITNVTANETLYDNYVNGEFIDQTQYTSYLAAIYASNCNLSVEDTTISDAVNKGFYLYGSVASIENVDIQNVGATGLDAGYYSITPDLTLEGVTVSGVSSGNGLHIRGSSNYPGGSVLISDVSVGSEDPLVPQPSNGIQLDYLSAVQLSDFEVLHASNSGIYTNQTTANIFSAPDEAPSFILNPANYGIYAIGSALTLSDFSITSPGKDGVYSSTSDLDISNVSIVDPGESGFYLNGGTHSLNDNTVLDALDYGIECYSNPVFLSCENALDGLSGEVSSQCPECTLIYDEVCTNCCCPDSYEPVCGTNGLTYPNSCFAECADVSTAIDGSCEIEGEASCSSLLDLCANACEDSPLDFACVALCGADASQIALPLLIEAGYCAITAGCLDTTTTNGEFLDCAALNCPDAYQDCMDDI